MLAVRLLPAVVTVLLVSGLPLPASAQVPCQGPYGPVACDYDAEPYRYAGGYRPPRPYYPSYRRPRYVAPPPPYPFRPGYQQGYQPGYQPGYPGQPPAQYAPELITSIQAGLDYLGYNPGPVDGIFGGRTQQAIFEFQQDAGLAVNGVPSDELYAQLKLYWDENQ